MKHQKTWLTVHFTHGQAAVEAEMNYKTKDYSLSNGPNDQTVKFGRNGDTIQMSIDRAKCVMAALKFIKAELFNEEPAPKKEGNK